MKNIIYLDHNATTPVLPGVLKAMGPFYNAKFGNASSLHQKGREASAAVEEGRTIIGDFLGTESVDIIFTSGGTESNNLAIKGVAFKSRDPSALRPQDDMERRPHIITSSVEHLAVLETCKFLETHGFDITYLPVDEYGMVNPVDVKESMTDRTILVTIMHANNEVGTIQPIADIAKIIKEANDRRARAKRSEASPKGTTDEQQVYFHTDAVQSFGKIPVEVEGLGVDLLSISAHKIYGPKGIGALYIRKGTRLLPLSHGGHHERNLRAGTEDVPAIVGFAKAVELVRDNDKEIERVRSLRDRLYHGLSERIKGIKLNGDLQRTLPNTLSVGFKEVEGESLLLNFDLKGICASTGSACTSGSVQESHVLKAMGIDNNIAQGTVRFSLGITNRDSDIDYCIKVIPDILKRLRST